MVGAPWLLNFPLIFLVTVTTISATSFKTLKVPLLYSSKEQK